MIYYWHLAPKGIAYVQHCLHHGLLFVEADRLVEFTRFLTHSGTKEVRSREVLRPLLLLDLFAEGTNTGIKRVATANQRTLMTNCSTFANTTSQSTLYAWPTRPWSTRS